MDPKLSEIAHRRYNPLSGEWVLVSPHRAKRPWQGQVERAALPVLPAYDPKCYLCPGNQRVNGAMNPDYAGTYVFDNDFQALTAPAASQTAEAWQAGLLRAEPEAGRCRVVCFLPDHNRSLPQMRVDEIEAVVAAWSAETEALGKEFQYVQVFENKGAVMGSSNPHPHSQIWATASIPNEPMKELAQQRAYYEKNGRVMLADYLEQELAAGERLVAQNEGFAALVPFWALWPFELLVLPRFHVSSLPELDDRGRKNLAEILSEVTIRYDNLFETSFPYSMGFHQAPFDGQAHPEWLMHLHFYPPLLRSATVRKFMVGFELLGMPQRDLTAEQAAERLRALSSKHYLSE